MKTKTPITGSKATGNSGAGTGNKPPPRASKPRGTRKTKK